MRKLDKIVKCSVRRKPMTVAVAVTTRIHVVITAKSVKVVAVVVVEDVHVLDHLEDTVTDGIEVMVEVVVTGVIPIVIEIAGK